MFSLRGKGFLGVGMRKVNHFDLGDRPRTSATLLNLQCSAVFPMLKHVGKCFKFSLEFGVRSVWAGGAGVSGLSLSIRPRADQSVSAEGRLQAM